MAGSERRNVGHQDFSSGTGIQPKALPCKTAPTFRFVISKCIVSGLDGGGFLHKAGRLRPSMLTPREIAAVSFLSYFYNLNQA